MMANLIPQQNQLAELVRRIEKLESEQQSAIATSDLDNTIDRFDEWFR